MLDLCAKTNFSSSKGAASIAARSAVAFGSHPLIPPCEIQPKVGFEFLMVKIMVGRSYEVFKQEFFTEYFHAAGVNQGGDRKQHQYRQQYYLMRRHEKQKPRKKNELQQGLQRMKTEGRETVGCILSW
jgi:hypothetical protein